MKNIAIVGGSGFIGTQTASVLVNNKYNVTIIDIVKTNLQLKDNLKFIECDVTNLIELKKIFKSNNFDAVFMLAAISNSEDNLIDIPNSINQNILSLTNVLECVKTFNVERIIFSSTVWVYSVSNLKKVNEETELTIGKSNHIYTTCKLMCEALIKNYNTLYNVNYTILRYGIAYGPGCNPDTILYTFIKNAINNKTCTITGNGSIYRNFLYVTDHANANLLSLNEKAKNKIINVDGDEKVTLSEVAETVKELHGSLNVKYTNKRDGDYKGKVVSKNRSRKLLNWKPKINFKLGASIMYEYLKNTK